MDIGKIYKIVGYGLTYYGSTTESIKRRLARHQSHYLLHKEGKRTDRITVFDIFDKGNEYTIELVEHFLCDNKKDLLDKENYYIYNNVCVNKCIPNRTIEQLKERQREYNEKHKDQIKEASNKYAEKKRREKGQKLKSEMTLTKDPSYKANKAKEYRAKMTEEEKEEHLKKRRETRKPLTEEQKIKARERAKKQREDKKALLIIK